MQNCERHWISHLDEMVQKKTANSSSSPFWMSKKEWNICLIICNIRHHERKANDQFPTTWQRPNVAKDGKNLKYHIHSFLFLWLILLGRSCFTKNCRSLYTYLFCASFSFHFFPQSTLSNIGQLTFLKLYHLTCFNFNRSSTMLILLECPQHK